MMRFTMHPRHLMKRPILLGSISAGAAAICYGSSQFLGRILVTEQAHPFVVATFAMLAGTVVLTAASSRSLVRDRRAPRRAWVLMVLAGLASSAGVMFNLFALKLAPVVIVSPVSAVSPLIALALAHIFLQRLEKITRRMWLGTALVVIGVIFVAVGSR